MRAPKRARNLIWISSTVTRRRGGGGRKKMKEKIEFIKPLMNFEVINLITSPFNFFKKYQVPPGGLASRKFAKRMTHVCVCVCKRTIIRLQEGQSSVRSTRRDRQRRRHRPSASAGTPDVGGGWQSIRRGPSQQQVPAQLLVCCTRSCPCWVSSARNTLIREKINGKNCVDVYLRSGG